MKALMAAIGHDRSYISKILTETLNNLAIIDKAIDSEQKLVLGSFLHVLSNSEKHAQKMKHLGLIY